jgi:hypothetical protein
MALHDITSTASMGIEITMQSAIIAKQMTYDNIFIKKKVEKKYY